MDGKPLDDDATYTVMLMGFDDFLEHPTFCGSPLPEDLKAKRERQKMSYTNLDLVADVLGHSDVNTTKKHYAALEDERRRSARNMVHLREKKE